MNGDDKKKGRGGGTSVEIAMTPCLFPDCICSKSPNTALPLFHDVCHLCRVFPARLGLLIYILIIKHLDGI